MANKFVYVCSPLRGSDLHDEESNKKDARGYCKFVVLNNPDIIPVAPHIYLTQFLNDDIDEERAMGLGIGLELLKNCSEVWVFGERVSNGMAMEISAAAEMGLKIRWFDKYCKERVRIETGGVETDEP